ncbi:MAG: hypothetical protein AAFY41_11830 [Bacteroidota bacterium]
MRFYKLNLTADEKIIGQYPQTKIIEQGDFGLEKNIRLGHFGPIGELLNKPKLRFEDNALVTDAVDNIYLSYSLFLIISSDLLDLFIEFTLKSFKTYDVFISHRSKVFDYKLFHVDYPSNDEFINFERSEFYIGKRGVPPSDLLVEIHHFEEYLKRQKQAKADYPGSNLLCKKLMLDLSQCELDLFRLTVGPALGYFVSEKLKNVIETEGFTGFAFKEIEEDTKIEVLYG